MFSAEGNDMEYEKGNEKWRIIQENWARQKIFLLKFHFKIASEFSLSQILALRTKYDSWYPLKNTDILKLDTGYKEIELETKLSIL
jgi:hypothetical protein